MSTEIDETIGRALQYLKGGPADAHAVLAWRKKLRQHKQPALARELSRKLAEQFIGGVFLKFEEADALWKACKTDEAFSHARRVLYRMQPVSSNLGPAPPPSEGYTPSSVQKIQEQRALMTSKDPDLAASVRHKWALEILAPNLQTSTAETLGIAGGIWKRRWELDGKRSSLEQSLRHYLAPVERGQAAAASIEEHDRAGRGVTAEDGYPAINAAFICDLLAHISEEESNKTAYRARAADLRKRICKSVTGNSYWISVTLAEAHFGLDEIPEADELLQKAKGLEKDPWERDTTARQLARLGAARGMHSADTERVVTALVGDGLQGGACVQSVLVGKVGLALSGGGFRASLYHLGVLARLAESDLLRHVETLSTVSGGSMVGAAYYLRLRKLLSESDPTRATYVTLVKDLIEDFRQGTNANLRSSLLMDLDACNAILSGNDEVYAERLAAAVFKALYSRTVDKDPHMSTLAISPKGAEAHFHPRYHNIHRQNKVPALLLNTTALNTGHSWQFTTTSMGESPFSIVAGADPLPRLRRSYYFNQHGETVRGVTLSEAVTASACVPGLFAPLALTDLYAGYEVRLVDGGVYDNQGALGLLQEDCSVLIVSDACGQLGLDPKPGGGHVSPLLRGFNIFQERMRQASYENLRTAKEHGRLGGLAYVHLKQDLETPPVDWKNCEDPSREDDQLPRSARNNPTTRFGVWKSHQALLADIRTDLDVFSDIESAALMASGYLAMDVEVQQLMTDVPALNAEHEPTKWFFSDVIPHLRVEHAELKKHLEAGAVQFLRLMKLDDTVRRKIWAIAAIVLLIAAFVPWLTWNWSITISVGWIVVFALPFLVRYLRPGWSWTSILADPVRELRSKAYRWLAVLGTWTVANRLVPKLTQRYLENGKLERLAGDTGKATPV